MDPGDFDVDMFTGQRRKYATILKSTAAGLASGIGVYAGGDILFHDAVSREPGNYILTVAVATAGSYTLTKVHQKLNYRDYRDSLIETAPWEHTATGETFPKLFEFETFGK